MFCVAVVLVVAPAAAGWFAWLPRYRPSLHGAEKYGIDVSAHQRNIDWAKVARDHISFAYLKATEGSDFVDSAFTKNWADARAAGIERGAYHFFTLCTPGNAQARNFLRVVPMDEVALAPAVDLELKGNCHARPNTSTVHQQLADFLTALEAATGKPTVLYVGHDFDHRYHVRAAENRPLWLRRLLRRPSNPWTVWQIDGFAHVHGVHGGVDLDLMR